MNTVNHIKDLEIAHKDDNLIVTFDNLLKDENEHRIIPKTTFATFLSEKNHNLVVFNPGQDNEDEIHRDPMDMIEIMEYKKEWMMEFLMEGGLI